MAYRSYYGGRFEILKRGFIGKGYLYDINSAYPYALTQIPDLSKGKWIKQKRIHKGQNQKTARDCSKEDISWLMNLW